MTSLSQNHDTYVLSIPLSSVGNWASVAVSSFSLVLTTAICEISTGPKAWGLQNLNRAGNSASLQAQMACDILCYFRITESIWKFQYVCRPVNFLFCRPEWPALEICYCTDCYCKTTSFISICFCCF